MAKKKATKKTDKNTSVINGLLLSDARAEGHLLIIDTPQIEVTIDLLWSGRMARDNVRDAVNEATEAADRTEQKIGPIGHEQIWAALQETEAMEQAEAKQKERPKKSAKKRNMRD